MHTFQYANGNGSAYDYRAVILYCKANFFACLPVKTCRICPAPPTWEYIRPPVALRNTKLRSDNLKRSTDAAHTKLSRCHRTLTSAWFSCRRPHWVICGWTEVLLSPRAGHRAPNAASVLVTPICRSVIRL